MSKVLQIAAREFVATVFTKAFIIGLLVFPAMIGVASLVGPRLFGSDRNFAIAGQLAVVDPTSEVTPELRTALTKGTPAADLAAVIRAARGEAGGGHMFSKRSALRRSSRSSSGRPAPTSSGRRRGCASRTRTRRTSRSR